MRSMSVCPALSFGYGKSSALTAFSSAAGIAAALAIAMLQRLWLIGIEGKPCRGSRICAEITRSNWSLCATVIHFGLLAASMNSCGTASPGAQSCTGSLSTA